HHRLRWKDRPGRPNLPKPASGPSPQTESACVPFLASVESQDWIEATTLPDRYRKDSRLVVRMHGPDWPARECPRKRQWLIDGPANTPTSSRFGPTREQEIACRPKIRARVAADAGPRGVRGAIATPIAPSAARAIATSDRWLKAPATCTSVANVSSCA